MADEVGESLKLNIKITSTGEKKLQTIAESVAMLEKSLGSVTTQFKAFGAAVSSIDTSGLTNAKGAIKDLGKAATDAQKAADGVQDPLKAAGDAANDIANNTKKAGDAAKNAGKDGQKTANNLGKSFDKLLKSIGRVAFYRAIRTLLKGITDGFKTGIQNLARYSSEANASMSKLATASLYIKNSLGAAAMPIIEQMLPALLKLANYAVKALNAINQLMSALQGKSTYTRAKEYAVDYAATLDKSTSNASKSVQKLKRDLMGFDELNVLSAPDTGASAGGGGEDYSQMFEEAEISKEFEKAAKIVEKLKDNLDIVLGIVGAIAYGIKMWDLYKTIKNMKKFKGDAAGAAALMKNIAKITAGIGLLVLGVTLAYNGAKAAGSAIIPNFLDYVKSALGVAAAAVGGALIGSTIAGGAGAAVGAVIGVIVGVAFAFKGYYDGIRSVAEDAYKLTDNYKVMANVISSSNKIIEDSQGGIDTLRKNIEGLSDIQASVGAARSLADEIYALSDKSNKSAYEMELMRVKVATLNDMGLDGLSMSIDETTGKVVQTKDSIYSVIDALEEQAKMAALQDILTDAYKEQYKAQRNIEEATQKNSVAWAEYNSAYQSYMNLTKDATWFQKKFNKEMLQAEERMNTASKAVDDTEVALNNATLAYNSQSDAIKYYSDQLAAANGASSDWASQVTNSKEDTVQAMYDYGSNVVSAFDAGAKEVKDSEEYRSFWEGSFIGDIIDWVKEKLGIHSPSRVFKDFGENTIQGFWDGIKEKWSSFKSWWQSLELPSFKIKTPHIEWSTKDLPTGDWKYKILSALGIPTQIPKLNVKWYAKGGFPEDGLFMANHNELVGQFSNGRTAVANNAQIQAGIEEAAYRGFMRAISQSGGMGGQGGTYKFVAELNGKTLFEEVVNQNNSTVKSTGATPLMV